MNDRLCDSIYFAFDVFFVSMNKMNEKKSLVGGSGTLMTDVVNLLIPISLFLGAKGLSYVSNIYSSPPQQLQEPSNDKISTPKVRVSKKAK